MRQGVILDRMDIESLQKGLPLIIQTGDSFIEVLYRRENSGKRSNPDTWVCPVCQFESVITIKGMHLKMHLKRGEITKEEINKLPSEKGKHRKLKNPSMQSFRNQWTCPYCKKEMRPMARGIHIRMVHKKEYVKLYGKKGGGK